MKIVKNLSPFILLLIIGVISFRFLFFISFIKVQKSEFRRQLISESSTKVKEIKFSNIDVFKDKNGFEWKEKNKELVIKGIYHEVIAVKKYKDYTLISVIEDAAENSLFKKFFSVNKGMHKDFADLIKLLVNLTYLQNISEIVFNKTVIENMLNSNEIQFSSFQFYLKQIKPPQA